MTPERKAYVLSLAKLPHMNAAESQVGQAWLRKHADEWDDVDFDVPLGTAQQLGEGFSDATQSQATAVTRKRADIVATRGKQTAIVEVKTRLTLAALGQLLGYSILWRAENPAAAPPQLIAAGHDSLLDVADLLQAHGITVELFPNVAILTP